MLLIMHKVTVDHEGVPTDEEIQQALQLRKTYTDAVIVLKWYVEYSGWYDVAIYETDQTVDDVRKRILRLHELYTRLHEIAR